MKVIECPVCGERTLALRRRTGRTMLHRNVQVAIPADCELPECSACGARPLDQRAMDRLTPVLEVEYGRWLADRAQHDLDRLGEYRPLYEWERLLNLSAGYLSKLRGDKVPSAQLAALLRLLANHPERAQELEGLWRNEPSSVVVTEVVAMRATGGLPSVASSAHSKLTLVHESGFQMPARRAA